MSQTEHGPSASSESADAGFDSAHAEETVRLSPTPAPGETIEVLLVEDDAQDAVLVQELLDETSLSVRITWVTTLAEAQELLPSFQGCVLLDLNLPDARGMELLRAVLDLVSSAAVVVLTGLHDEQEGVAAVAAGAQDYLVKGQVNGSLLARSLRYSVERQRSDENARQLREAELHSRENLRLERGLLPQVLLRGSRLSHRSFYRPGRKRAVVGGDFFDAVGKDGTTHLVIGDVSGHGPDEAALGVCLRIAWRALVMGGVSEEAVLPALEEILVSERAQEEMYATLCQVSLDTDSDTLRVRLLGHPPPMVVTDTVTPITVTPRPPLGVFPGTEMAVEEYPFPEGATLVLYTDGLVEAYDGASPDRLGVEGLHRFVEEAMAAGRSVRDLPEYLVDAAEQRNGGPLQDDVAMLLVGRGTEW